MKIPDDEVNGVLTGYVVSYKAVKVGGKKAVDEVVKKRKVGADSNSLMLDGLQSFATYEIKVAGLTRRGEGPFSNATYAGKTFLYFFPTSTSTEWILDHVYGAAYPSCGPRRGQLITALDERSPPGS